MSRRYFSALLLPLFLAGAGCRGRPPTPPVDGGVPAPANDWSRQVIYLALVDRFANGSTANDALGPAACYDPANPRKWHGGDFVGLRDRLPYLGELGVGAVWITPAYQQSGAALGRCGYHGYWGDFADPDDGAVEPRLGTAAELTALVNALHGANMAFMLDIVVNHAGNQARILNQHPDWFHDPATCAQLGDPTIYCPFFGGNDFAQEKPQVAAYLSTASAGWTERTQLDAIRMDTARHVEPAYFRDSWIPAVRAVRPLFLVAENFTDNIYELVPYLDAGFDSAFNFPLRGALIGAVGHEQSLDAVANVLAAEQSILGETRARTLVNFIDNHDTRRFASEPGIDVPNDEIRRRLQLALAIMFVAPGIPQLYAGDELGLFGGNDPDNRRDMPAWAWTAVGRMGSAPPDALPNAQDTFAFVQKLISLRRTRSALAVGSYRELWRPNGSQATNVLAFWRVSGDEQLVFVANGGAAQTTVKIPLQALFSNGVMLDDLIGAGATSSVQVADGALNITLPPKAAALYRPR